MLRAGPPLAATPLLSAILLLGGCAADATDDEPMTFDGGTDASSADGANGNDARTLPDTLTDGGPGPQSVPVRVQLQTALGGGLSGAEVHYRNQSRTSDGEGRATVRVLAGERFTISANKSGFRDHRLVGRSGHQGFPYITFVASKVTTSQVFGGVGVSIDSDEGILVVGVDTENLQPLTGASVDIGASHDQAITLSTNGVDANARIDPGEQSFVSFPNVEPGQVTPTIDTPGGETCRLYPAGGSAPNIEVKAGAVTVAPFICS
ncbi:MAG: hypothetical protein ABEL76_13640 [Bradymonadaceae bacterium]